MGWPPLASLFSQPWCLWSLCQGRQQLQPFCKLHICAGSRSAATGTPGAGMSPSWQGSAASELAARFSTCRQPPSTETLLCAEPWAGCGIRETRQTWPCPAQSPGSRGRRQTPKEAVGGERLRPAREWLRSTAQQLDKPIFTFWLCHSLAL